MDTGAARLLPDPVDPDQLVPAFALYENPKVIELRGLPMPPSMNNVYRTFHINGKAMRGKSPALRAFERDMANWALTSGIPLRMARQMATSLRPGFYLTVDCEFYFHRSSILTVKGLPKKMDASNRLKPMHDMLAQLLGIDDCHFWSGSFRKKEMLSDKIPEHATVTLSIHSPP